MGRNTEGRVVTTLALWLALCAVATPIYLFLVWALAPDPNTTEESLP